MLNFNRLIEVEGSNPCQSVNCIMFNAVLVHYTIREFVKDVYYNKRSFLKTVLSYYLTLKDEIVIWLVL